MANPEIGLDCTNIRFLIYKNKINYMVCMAGMYVCSDVYHKTFFCQFDTTIIFVVENIYRCCHAAWVAVQRAIGDLGRTSGSALAGLKRGDGREGGETGGARLRPGALIEPRDDAVDIDGGRDRDVLYVGLRCAPIPRPS